MCHGVFDLVHVGHMRHFESARNKGDVLVVTLTGDAHVNKGPGRPYFSQGLRAESLASLAAIDYVCVLEEDSAIGAIRKLRPAIYAKGPDYREKRKDITGRIQQEEAAIKAVGGKLLITDGVSFSSSHLINVHLEDYSAEIRAYLAALGRKYPIDHILHYFTQMGKLRVMVIGDAIIDQYHYCAQMGKSSKEPLVVNRYLSEESHAGGALACANHVASAGGAAQLVSVLGKQDSWREFIGERLLPGVQPRFFYRTDAGTTIKRRYVSNVLGRKLFELCFMEDSDLPRAVEARIAAYLERDLPKADLVIVNDFGHGFLSPRLVQLICRKSRRLAVNVQTNSANAGFNLVTKYPRADYVCVDEMELRLATHDRRSNLGEVGKRIFRTMSARLLMTTRGAEGSLSYSRKGGVTTAPALAFNVVDPVGAGDALFAYTSLCYAVDMPDELIAFIGNAVGSLAVRIVGNREPVKKVDVLKFLTRLLK